MTSIGYNFAAAHHGEVRTYFRSGADIDVQLCLWEMAQKMVEVAHNHVKEEIGPWVCALMARCVYAHYVEPLMARGHMFAALNPPVLGLGCTSIQQTCNAQVLPQKDSNDLVYTGYIVDRKRGGGRWICDVSTWVLRWHPGAIRWLCACSYCVMDVCRDYPPIRRIALT